jgi:LPS export ABC transporter protein LptC
MRGGALLLILLIVMGCQENGKSDKSISEVKQEIKKFRITETTNGIPIFILKAEEGVGYRDSTLVYKVEVKFYKEGKVFASLIADSGVIYEENSNMKAMGKVKVETASGEILKTTSLHWIHKEGKIKTKEKVVIIMQDGKKIEGKNFESTPDLKYIKLKEVEGEEK